MDRDEAARLFEEGVRLFNLGEYFEAHEVWEELWLEDVSDDRELYQGLIQAAAAFHKLERGVPAGTAKLLRSCLPLLRLYPEVRLGLDLDAFRRSLEACRREAQRLLEGELVAFDRSLVPKLRRAGDG